MVEIHTFTLCMPSVLATDPASKMPCIAWVLLRSVMCWDPFPNESGRPAIRGQRLVRRFSSLGHETIWNGHNEPNVWLQFGFGGAYPSESVTSQSGANRPSKLDTCNINCTAGSCPSYPDMDPRIRYTIQLHRLSLDYKDFRNPRFPLFLIDLGI